MNRRPPQPQQQDKKGSNLRSTKKPSPAKGRGVYLANNAYTKRSDLGMPKDPFNNSSQISIMESLVSPREKTQSPPKLPPNLPIVNKPDDSTQLPQRIDFEPGASPRISNIRTNRGGVKFNGRN